MNPDQPTGMPAYAAGIETTHPLSPVSINGRLAGRRADYLQPRLPSDIVACCLIVDGTPETAGGKAWQLARLRRFGLPVPDFRVLPAETNPDSETFDDIIAELAAPGWLDHPLAVRSSAVGEDDAQTSFAGIYPASSVPACSRAGSISRLRSCNGRPGTLRVFRPRASTP
jgi:hypothetical protein